MSATHGVGVFAIRDIPAGANICPRDDAPIVWVERSALADLSEAERAFYHDFGIRDGGRIGCPASFELLTPGWYLNEPPPGEEPNVRAAAGVDLVAARDIAAGEELTVRYATFSR